jgi:hypothetical protein
MEKIDFALISDGGSDKTLIPLLKWLLRRTFNQAPINGERADFSRFPSIPRTLQDYICLTIEFYRPDVLFIHRDAEAQDPNLRYDEIWRAITEARQKRPNLPIPHICVVPIRMTEAWLLFDEHAIRKAAGNPAGRRAINIPALNRLEGIPDPKDLLFTNLMTASELTGRKRKRFNPAKRRYRIAENIEDYSPLFALSAFRRLHEDIKKLASGR